MSKNLKIAQEIKAAADNYGWQIDGTKSRAGILRITKRGIVTKDDFVKADGEYYWILGLLPQSNPGSIWGTDGGGVQALDAMRTGVFTMNKSGGNKLVLRQLGKLI